MLARGIFKNCSDYANLVRRLRSEKSYLIQSQIASKYTLYNSNFFIPENKGKKTFKCDLNFQYPLSIDRKSALCFSKGLDGIDQKFKDFLKNQELELLSNGNIIAKDGCRIGYYESNGEMSSLIYKDTSIYSIFRDINFSRFLLIDNLKSPSLQRIEMEFLDVPLLIEFEFIDGKISNPIIKTPLHLGGDKIISRLENLIRDASFDNGTFIVKSFSQKDSMFIENFQKKLNDLKLPFI